jgi:Arc/MetJ-type ribon-helix-helix transcriptional regulator
MVRTAVDSRNSPSSATLIEGVNATLNVCASLAETALIVSGELSIPSPLWYCSLMALNVSREFEAELRTRLKSGPYRSAEEFLRAKIRLADEYAEQIRAAIAEGAAQADRGELIPGDQVFAELDQLILDVERAKPEE